MRLWQSATSDAQKLAKKERAAQPAPKRVRVQPSHHHVVFTPHTAGALPTLKMGAYAGIDRNTAERFRKGKTQIDAALDLHGMSREQAHMALSAFVRANYEQGNRCLLAITGKGYRDGSGVLRELLPHWLDEPGLRPYILALDTAAKHGGSGAYYILLKRKRETYV